MPQCRPKINTGSKMMLTIAPTSMEAIDQEGLPSARITAFIILESIYTGKNAKMMLKYSTAIPILFSEAPKSVKSCIFSGKNTTISTMLATSVVTGLYLVK